MSRLKSPLKFENPPTTRWDSAKYMQKMVQEAWTHTYRPIGDTTGDESVAGKIVVITGGNSGIGKSTVIEMAKRGATVVVASRNVKRSEELAQTIMNCQVNPNSNPTARVIVVHLDLSDFRSVRQCARQIMAQVPHINILINNAGIARNDSQLQRTPAGIERHLATNHLGHFLLTLLLLPHIKKGAPSRILTVGSMGCQNADLNIGDLNMEADDSVGALGCRAYGNSKLCNFLFSRELGRRLKAQGVTQITTYALCPGAVRTEIGGRPEGFQKFVNWALKSLCASADQGAETVMYCAVSSEVSQESGQSYRLIRIANDLEALFSAPRNAMCAVKLWEKSEQLVGQK